MTQSARQNGSPPNGKISSLYTSDIVLISKIYNELKKLATKTPNNDIKKWRAELNREFSTEESEMV